MEIHMSLSKEYSKVYDNEYDYLLGLSATIPEHLPVDSNDEDSETKGELLSRIAPIVYTYDIDDAISDGILSPFRTTVVLHQLNSKDKNLQEKTKTKGTWMTTESQYYAYRDGVRRNPYANSFWKGAKIREMCKLLWNLPSKTEPAKKLLASLTGKTIVFSVELKLLHDILGTDYVVSGKHSDVVNNQIISDFNNDKITVIGSAKKLKQGVTLEGVENCIILSYYKESWHTIQQLGRVVRFVEGKQANLYIFKTLTTLEEKWFNNINLIKDKDGKTVKEIDLNHEATILSDSIK